MKSEDAIQQECYIWFWNKYPELRGMLFHVPNGGTRDIREAKKMKQIGVTPGVSDLILLFNGTAYCFELKTEKGVQSTIQKEWAKKVSSQGINYYLIRSKDEFEVLVTKLIDGWGDLLS